MNALDYTLIVLYIAVLLGLGLRFRRQTGTRAYFLGDKTIGWPALTLSAMATQLGAISFVSAPAFVGLREGGGMIWLTYELGVPLAMLLLLLTVAPSLYRSGVVSIYEYVERRFGLSTRLILSLTFQLSRGLATAVTVYAVSLILETGFGMPFWQSLMIIGVGTVLYSVMGGMKAVVFGDALQMILIVLAILICLGAGLYELGGVGALLAKLDPDRLRVIEPGNLGFSGEEFGLLPMIFGGVVLYASYYGCDQTQAQRLLAAGSYSDARRVLIANGLLRFPITLAYCSTGLVIGTLALTSPEFGGQLSADEPDRMIPLFLLEYLPNGLIGFVFIGLLAAAMSSLSSAINSLAAVTIEDLTRLRGIAFSDRGYLGRARLAAIGWGVFTLAFSTVAGDIAPTVIEAINKVGSLFYGPILAMFLLATLSRRTGGDAATAGLLAGLLGNFILWVFLPQVFWFWWNFLGLSVALAVALIWAHFRPRLSEASAGGRAISGLVLDRPAWEELRRPSALVLLAMLAGIIVFGLALQS